MLGSGLSHSPAGDHSPPSTPDIHEHVSLRALHPPGAAQELHGGDVQMEGYQGGGEDTGRRLEGKKSSGLSTFNSILFFMHEEDSVL